MEDFSYEIIRSDRRSFRIRVLPDLSVQIRAPHRTSDRAIGEFVAVHRDWIERSRKRAADYAASESRIRYRTGETIPYLGEPCRLEIKPASSRQRVSIRDRVIVAEARDPDDEVSVRLLLARWYAARAKERFPPILESCLLVALGYGIPRPVLRVRMMRSRWGTCRPRALSITINGELVKYPPESTELVIMHELAHFIHRGHDQNFRDILSLLLPDWKDRKARLQKLIH
jgi:predicted metal-dependent hydrolase